MPDADALRCFVAIEIPEEAKEQLTALIIGLDMKGIKPVEPKNLHITLKFLGDVSASRLAAVEQRLRGIDFSSFPISLHGVGVFPDERYIRVVWVGCESAVLPALARNIEDALAEEFKKSEFTAHLTIARVKQKVNLRDFLERHKNDSFGEFTCNAFELMQSQLTSEGPVYSTLASFVAKG